MHAADALPPSDRMEADELSAVLARWPLSSIKRIEPFVRGSRRAPKVRLETPEGPFLLKRRQPGQDDPDRVAFAHAALAHLDAGGLPVAAPVPDREGRTAVRRGSHCYELFPFLPGRRPRPDVASAEAAGALLARTHLAGRDFDPPGPSASGSWHGVHGLARTLDELPDRLRSATAEADDGVRDGEPSDAEDLGRCCRFLRRAYTDARDRAAEGLDGPVGLMHGDWHPGNLLAAGGRLTAVLDFDAARLEPRMTDVANGCLQFSVDRPTDDPRDWPGVLGYDRIRAFLHAYEGVAGRLEDAERRALPWLMTEALIIESVVPIVREGRFGPHAAAPFLRMVERKVRWLRERSERLRAYLDETPGEDG